MKIKELLDYTGQLLQVARFRDYCPNGLQVEGKSDVFKIVTGVTASMALIEAAIAAEADMVIVHHGYFWKNEDARVIGMKRARLKRLLDSDMNLVAYHLPLDAHQSLGNNVQLALQLGIEIDAWHGEQGILASGSLKKPQSLSDFANTVSIQLGRTPMVIGDHAKLISRVALCTGAAQDYITEAHALGVDAYISGEISEQTVHISRENDIPYIAAGHHATERYGVKALGEHLSLQFNLQHLHVDCDNPV